MPTVRPASDPASGPGSASTSGGAAVGSSTRMRPIFLSPFGRASVRETPAMQAEVVAGGIRFGEGPVWCPPESSVGVGTLVVTSVCDGKLYRVFPDQQRFEELAETSGGPNAAALGT